MHGSSLPSAALVLVPALVLAGLGACGGYRCALRCGQIVADERGLPPREGQRQALSFLHEQSRRRAPALSPIQARQEALAITSVRSELGLYPEEDAT